MSSIQSNQATDTPPTGRAKLAAALLALLQREQTVTLVPESPGRCSARTSLAGLVGRQRRASPSSAPLIELRADSELAWFAGLQRLHALLKHNERHVRRQTDPVQGLRRWLHDQDDFTLIIDDIADFDLILETVDGLGVGRVILIPQSTAHLDEFPQRVNVPAWTARDATQLLLAEAGRIGGEGDDAAAAVELGLELCDHPISSRIAAVLIRQHKMTLPQLADCLAQVDVRPDSPASSTLGRLMRLAVDMAPPATDAIGMLTRASLHDRENIPLKRLLEGRSGDEATVLWLRESGLIESCDDDAAVTFPQAVHGLLRAVVPASRFLTSMATLVAEAVREDEDGCATVLHRDVLCAVATRQGSGRGTAILCRQTAELSREVGAFERASRWWDWLAGHAESTRLQRARWKELQGDCEMVRQRFRAAHDCYRESLAIEEATQSSRRIDRIRVGLAMASVEVEENLILRAEHSLSLVGVLLERTNARPSVEQARWLFLKGACCLARNEAAEAIPLLEESLQFSAGHVPPDHVDRLRALQLLARAHYAVQQFADAEAILRKDIDIRDASGTLGDIERSLPVNALAELLASRGRYVEAEPLFERVLHVREVALGRDHRLVGETAGRLAVLKAARGEYRVAEPLFRRALTINSEIYGSEHPEVARILTDLAESLFAQGKYDQSRRLLEQALRMQQRSLRATDPRIARTRNNLGALHAATGRFEMAAELYAGDLEARRASLPADHPAIATTLNNLADVYRALCRFADAASMAREALAIRRAALGDRHPLVAQSLSNLGYIDLQRGRLGEAKPAFEEALAIREAALAPDHPHVATTLDSLAEVVAEEGNLDRARTLFERALATREKVYGPNDPHSAAVRTRLGRLELRAGRQAKAELHLLRARSVLERSVGENHRYFADVLHGLAELQVTQDRHDEAATLLQRALTILRLSMAGERLALARILLDFGTSLLACGESGAARERLQEALGIYESFPGTSIRPLASCLLRYGQACQINGQNREARESFNRVIELETDMATDETVLREALVGLADVHAADGEFDAAEGLLDQLRDRIEQTDGTDSTALLPVLGSLAGVLQLQNRSADAIPVAERSRDIAEQELGCDHPEVARHLERLAALHLLSGRPDEAGRLVDRAVAILEARYGTAHPAVTQTLVKYEANLRQVSRDADADAVAERIDELHSRTAHVLDDIL
ncbi:tetratricopeptide repeat protein [Maioricimonas sp. JC845]|uniref:tetratricopeptide repeat protein n=1 Tax=Maioricimonas sp. JC845 TaxID=3232138 RepID=UPI00345915AE